MDSKLITNFNSKALIRQITNSLHACREYGLELAWSDVVPYFYLLVFRVLDAVILQQSLKLGKGGSTTVTGIPIDGQKLMVAKFGDSRAVMSRNGVVHQLSVDHEPSNERRYIEKRGGFVSNIPGDVPRVDGQLVIAKAFGDKRLKIHLSSKPDITHQAVGDQNEFIVFASDGI
ncbi:BnaC09g41410D [Brassica napus]|uniref:BnaC09g41410D protein n=1 Tax=Brassica napus TaxID=3708 RepID=A0A078IKR8_BRANA|nr:BnaC09g41410D [Brassica napus]